MAYNEEKLARLKHLKQLAQKAKAESDAVATRVKALEDAGAQANVLETIKVNGVVQSIEDKAVDIKMPTKVGDLTNDQKFQTETQVSTAIQTAISKSGHASFEKADSIPSAATAKENVLYLVMNAKTGHYDIYAKVNDEVVLLDDTTVDLSGYVQKETGKGLSTNDYTTDEKTKLAGIADGANKYVHPTHTAAASGLYKVTVDALGHVTATTMVTKNDITALGIPAQDTTYDEATTAKAGLMSAADKTKLDGMNTAIDKAIANHTATDAEVTEMLTEVFGATA